MTTRQHVPDAVLGAAHERARARRAGNWTEADRLKTQIEAAGWRIVDRGTDFRLEPATPPDLERDGIILYGASGSVPSVLADEPTALVSVILVASDASAIRAVAEDLRAEDAADRELVVVAEEPDGAMATVLAELEARPDGPHVIRTASGFTIGASCNAGARRARGGVIMLITEPIPRIATLVVDLAHHLEDPSVAVAGLRGSRTADLRTFEPVADDPDVIDLDGLAFRRADLVRLGPLDERFLTARALAAWWSLTLRFRHAAGSARAAGGDATSGDDRAMSSRNRRAVIVRGPESSDHPRTPDEVSLRAARRDFYRLRDAFAAEFRR